MNLSFRHAPSVPHEECLFRDLLVVVADRAIQEIAAAGRNGHADLDGLSGLLIRYLDAASSGDLGGAARMRSQLAAELERIGVGGEIVRFETNALVELFALVHIRYRSAGRELERIGRQYLFLSNAIARLQLAATPLGRPT